MGRERKRERRGARPEGWEGGNGGCLNHVAAPSSNRKYAAKMSAPDERTLADGDCDPEEEMDQAGSDEDDEGEGMEEEEGADGEGERKVYVPGIEPLRDGEELEMDRSAYRMYHECQTGKWEAERGNPAKAPLTSVCRYM